MVHFASDHRYLPQNQSAAPQLCQCDDITSVWQRYAGALLFGGGVSPANLLAGGEEEPTKAGEPPTGPGGWQPHLHALLSFLDTPC